MLDDECGFEYYDNQRGCGSEDDCQCMRLLSLHGDLGATFGLNWKEVGAAKPAHGDELTNAKLSAALKRKTVFTEDEWKGFGIEDLQMEQVVNAGDKYFKPIESCAHKPLNYHTRHQDAKENAQQVRAAVDSVLSKLDVPSTATEPGADTGVRDLSLEPYDPLEPFDPTEELTLFRKGFQLRVCSLVMASLAKSTYDIDDAICDPGTAIRTLAPIVLPTEDTKTSQLKDVAQESVKGMDNGTLDRNVMSVSKGKGASLTTLAECEAFLKPNLHLLHKCRMLGVECGESIRSLPTMIPNQINVDFMDYAVTGRKPSAPELENSSCFAYFVACMELEVAHDRIARAHSRIFEKLEVVANHSDRITNDIMRTMKRINNKLSVFDEKITVLEILRADELEKLRPTADFFVDYSVE